MPEIASGSLSVALEPVNVTAAVTGRLPPLPLTAVAQACRAPRTPAWRRSRRTRVGELAVLAARRGLDFLAVTDHNTVSHHAELALASARYGITLVAGQEVTTAAGHANVFGDTGWIDFRRTADEWLDAAAPAVGFWDRARPRARRAPAIPRWKRAAD